MVATVMRFFKAPCVGKRLLVSRFIKIKALVIFYGQPNKYIEPNEVSTLDACLCCPFD